MISLEKRKQPQTFDRGEDVTLAKRYLFSFPGPPPMNMMAPSPAVPNLLDGGGLLNPTPTGMPAQLQLNHEPIPAQNQNQDFSSGLYIELLLVGSRIFFCWFQKLIVNVLLVIERCNFYLCIGYRYFISLI